MAWTGTWPGGRIWTDDKGKTIFHIRREVGGKVYERSTRATTLKAAMAQLARFETDPEGYRPGGVPVGFRLVLDDVLIAEWERYCETELRNDREWLQKKKCYVQWWATVLKGKDLRRLDLHRDVLPHLEGIGGKRNRIEALKSVTKWLRSTGKLKATQDATMDLPVGAITPSQWRKPKVVSKQHHAKVVAVIGQPWKDVLTVLAATGMHLTELYRFCVGGTVVPLPKGRQDGATYVLESPRHKSGSVHRVAISTEVADAALRLREYGGWSEVNLRNALDKACKEAGVPKIRAGSYRHSVATWSIEAGAAPAAVAAFLGHRSHSTTMRFYATHAVPPRVSTGT